MRTLESHRDQKTFSFSIGIPMNQKREETRNIFTNFRTFLRKIKKRKEKVAKSTQVYPVVVTETLLKEITQKIVTHFHPEKVILFGSHAWGIPRPHSDVDLLVIMESDEDSVMREVRVSMICRPRFLPMDILVRTPKEIEERLRIGDFFIRRILERGRVLYERPRN